jgi:uncharacterized MnhB-related membrane protein
MIDLILVMTFIACASMAVLFKNQLRSAVALGAGSALLAALFFRLGAPYAGGFELSVGSGLTSILFIMAISLTEERGGE